MAILWILMIGMFLVSYLVQNRLKNKFKKYSKIASPNNMSGAEIAQRMLNENGIYDVKIQSTRGTLTDHYNPTNNTVNLSNEVYNGRSIMAVAVAAHECGHAVQYARAYAPVKLRSALVPVVSFASSWVQWLLLAGILFVQSFPQLLIFGIALFAMTTLFSFVTLPVEIDASRRALVWLKQSGITTVEMRDNAKDALSAAAYTYVVAAIGSLVTLLYYVMIFLGRRN
ncbi:MAG: zinc metallopeptidase [Bacteroidaceae bacterium]